MGVTSEVRVTMPKYMDRRGPVYYLRRVLPRDLQAALGRKEIWKSLRTKELPEAKERLHIELVRFDAWVRSEREKLVKTRQMPPANENARPSAIAEAMEEDSREADAHFTQVYGLDD